MKKAFYNLHLISNGEISIGKAVIVLSSKIVAIVHQDDIPSDTEKINLQGAYLAPGLIDLQIYGSGAKLFAGKPEEAALEQLETDLLQQGTTGFFATIGTNTPAIF